MTPLLRDADREAAGAADDAMIDRGAGEPDRLERLRGLLLATGTAVEDAIRACGWARTQTAGAAARRAGNITLARTLEEVA